LYWLTLSSSRIEGETLTLRFVPDTFQHESDSAAFEVRIKSPEDPERALDLVSRFREIFVAELTVDERELQIFGEMDEDPTILRGASVSSNHVPYSAEELLGISKWLYEELSRESSRSVQLRAKLVDVRHFVSDLADRAEKKLSMSQRVSPAVDAQLAVLRRILNRMGEA
jgi:hypothetical protein